MSYGLSVEVIPQKNNTSNIYLFVEQLLEMNGGPNPWGYSDWANFYYQY